MVVTIRLEKHISKISKLIYEVSLNSSIDTPGVARGVTSGTGILSSLNKSTKTYTTGVLSIDIIVACPTSRSARYSNLNPENSKQPDNEAREIFENDKRVAYFLGRAGMPGHVTSSYSAGNGVGNVSMKSRDDDMFQYLQNHGENSFQWSRYHTKLLSHLAASADLVEAVCRLDSVSQTHIYLRALILLTNITNSVRCRDRIFANIKKTLPKAFFHSLGFLRWLCIIPSTTVHKSPAPRRTESFTFNEPEMSSQSSQQVMFTYDILIIEINQIASVFLEVKISGLGNLTSRLDEKTKHYSSDVSSTMPVEVNTNDIVQCILKSLRSLDFDPVVLRRSLSTVAMSPLSVISRNPYQRRLGLLNMCYLESVCHFSEVKLTSRNLVESLVSDICRSKIAMGFQVMSCMTSENSVELSLCAVLSSCPSGIATDSLIQCMVESSDEGILTTYFWEPSNGVVVRNHIGLSPMNIEQCLARFTINSKSKVLLEYLKLLIKQDLDTHTFYCALSSIYTFGCTKIGKVTSQLSSSGSSSHNLPVLMISAQNWMCLYSYSKLFVNELCAFSENFYSGLSSPCNMDDVLFLNSPDMYKNNGSVDGSKSDSGEDFIVVEEFKKQLLLFMVEYVGLSRVVVNDPSDPCDGDRSTVFSCCYPLRDGVFMVEIKPAHDNVREVDQFYGSNCMITDSYETIGRIAPHPDMMTPDIEGQHSIDNIDLDYLVMSPSSYADDNDYASADRNDQISLTPQQRLSSKEISTPVRNEKEVTSELREVEGTLDDESGSRTVIQNTASGKISLEYRYLPVPVNALFADDDMISFSKQCVLATSAASNASSAVKTVPTSSGTTGDGPNMTPTATTSTSDVSKSIPTSSSYSSFGDTSNSTTDAVTSIQTNDTLTTLDTSSQLSSLPLAMRKQLKRLMDDIEVYSRCSFVLVLYTAIRNKSIRQIHPLDLTLALDFCSKQEHLEVDITTLCREKRRAMMGTSDSSGFLSSPDLFRSTVGKLMTSIVNSDCFIFSADSRSYGIPMVNSIYRIALFIKISIVLRSTVSVESVTTSSEIDVDDEQTEEVIIVPANDQGLSQALFEVCQSSSRLLSAAVKNTGELFDESILLRLECFSSSATDMTNTAVEVADADQQGISTPSSERGFGGSVPSLGSLQSAYRSSLIRRLTSELQNYVTFDTLQSLLLVPIVNAETVLLVQHCLRETKNVINTGHTVDFLTPPNRNINSFMDSISAMVEDELLKHMELKKVNAIFYARGCSIPVPEIASTSKSDDVETDGAETTPSAREKWIPCWILLTIAQCTSVPTDLTSPGDDCDDDKSSTGGHVVEDMTITSMELLITIRTIGEYDVEQKLILRKLCDVIDQCACRVNQFNLLKEMHESRAASSYLIADCSTAVSKAKNPKKSGILSSSRRDNRRYSGGQRVYDDPPDLHSSTVIPTFKFPGFHQVPDVKSDILDSSKPEESSNGVTETNLDAIDEEMVNKQEPGSKLSLSWRGFSPGHFACPRQGSIACLLPMNHASALYHDLAIRRLEDSALHPFTISNLRSCFVYQNRDGNLYYMAFEPSADREERKINLVVFGISPLEDTMIKHLTDLLETKIIEQMAKVVSIMCLRQKKLQLSDLHFVKNSAKSRHINVMYNMPTYVSDYYYFLTIVKQVFNVSNVFFGNDVLDVVQDEEDVKIAEILHPATFGYAVWNNKVKGEKRSKHSKFLNITRKTPSLKDRKEDNSLWLGEYCSSSDDSDEDVESDTSAKVVVDVEKRVDTFEETDEDGEERVFTRLGHHSINRPYIERKTHVEVETKKADVEVTSSDISPVFFPKHMRKQCPRQLQVYGSGSSILWKQKDFTFLYNYQTGAGEKNVTSVMQSRIGQGLALIELEPMLPNKTNSNIPVTPCECVAISKLEPKDGGSFCLTGSPLTLLSDAEQFVRHVQGSEGGDNPTLPTLVPCSASSSSFTSHMPNADAFFDQEPSQALSRKRQSTILVNRSKGSGGPRGNGNDVRSKTVPPKPPSSKLSVDNDAPFALNLRIYPTFPMNTTALVDHCSSCFNQALEIYCMERLFSAYRIHTEMKTTCGKSDGATESTINSKLGGSSKSDSLENVALTKFLKTKDLFDSSHKLLSSISETHAKSGVLTKSGLIDIPFAFPKNSAIALHNKILQTIYDSHAHLQCTAISPVSLMATKWNHSVCESDSPFGGHHQEVSGSKRIEWLDRVNVTQACPVQNSCSSLLGDNFAAHVSVPPSDVRLSFAGTERVTTVSETNTTVSIDGSVTHDSNEQITVDAFEKEKTSIVDEELRCFTDYVPSCCDMTSALFPMWLRRRHYSLEITITPIGIRVAYFNIVKNEMKKILGIVSFHGQEAIRHMQSTQRLSLHRIGVLSEVNFGKPRIDEKIVHIRDLKDGNSTSTSGVVDCRDMTDMLDESFMKNSEFGPTTALSFAELSELQAQICGLFWSFRVLSRLHMFEDTSGTQNAPLGTNDKNQVIKDLALIPKYMWSVLGLSVADFCLPLTSLATSDHFVCPMFSGLVRKPSFITRGPTESTSDSSDCDTASVAENNEEAYVICLRHLIKSYECIFVDSTTSVNNSSTGSATKSNHENNLDQDLAESNSFIILPIPRTSSLCVFELNRQHVPGDGSSNSVKSTAALNWLIVSQRVLDVGDVVNKLAAHYNVRPVHRLLSPVSEACLQQPSLQKCLRVAHSEALYAMDPYGSSDFGSQMFEDSNSSLDENSSPVPPVLGTILESKSVLKVANDIYFAALASFFFFPPSRKDCSGAREGTNCDMFPIARLRGGEGAYIVPAGDIQCLESITTALGNYVIFSDDILSPIEVQKPSGINITPADEHSKLVGDGLPSPSSADVLESFVLSAAEGSFFMNNEKACNNVICFRFVMNKHSDMDNDNESRSTRTFSMDENTRKVNSVDDFGYYSDNILGISLLRGGLSNENSFSLVSCIFEGSQISGEEKFIAGNPLLLQQMKKLRTSGGMISICSGSEGEMLCSMKACVTACCHEMIDAYYKKTAWKQLLECSAGKQFVSTVSRSYMRLRNASVLLPPKFDCESIAALCMGGHQVLLPLATLFAFSHSEKLNFLSFLYPSLEMFNSTHTATFLYNLFLKSFKGRTFFILPDLTCSKPKGDKSCFQFIITCETCPDPYLLLIKIKADDILGDDNAISGGVSISLVESRFSASSQRSDDSPSYCCSDNNSQVFSLSGQLNIQSPPHNSIKNGQVSVDDIFDHEPTRSDAKILIENVVNIVLYASNVLLSQEQLLFSSE